MDKDLLYQNFLANGGNASYEEFQILQSQFMVESPDEELKKKDQPIENGNPPSTQPMEVATPISQDLELNQEQIQQLPDPTSQSSGITAEQLSTDLPLTNVASSGTGSSDNVNLTQQPTYTKPSVGAMVYPIGNEEIGQYNERVGERNRTITAQIPSVTTTKPAVIKQQELINTLKQPEFTLTPEAEKNLDEILKISDDEIKESEDFIKKFTYGEYDEKPIVNKQPFDSWGVAPDDQSDDNLLALESRGLIQIDRDAEGAPVFEDNKYRYKIIDKTFYDNDYSNYIDNLQREETKKWEEANVDKARTDLNEGKDRFAKGESTPDITPLQDRLNEYYRKTGELFSQDNIEKINTEEGFAQLLAEGIAKKNVAENPSLDYNQEYEKALKAESPYTDEQLTLAGINLIGELARGVSLTKDMHKTMLESTNRDFTDADDLDGELAFFQKIQQNPDYARQFAKYWYTGGGREAFGASETRLKATFNSQEGRSELMDSFEAYRNANSVANYEANKEIFNQTKEDIKKARASKDVNAVVAGVDKLQAVQEKIKENKDYFESFGTLSDERKSVQKIVQKKQLEQQQNEADYKNALFGTAKGNVSAVLNGVLDAGKDLVLGIPRLLNNVTAQSDAANFYMDVVGKPTQIFNVKTSSMLEKITTYDLAGRQIEERNGFLFEKKNDKLTPVTLTSEERSNLVKKDSRTDFSGKGFFGTVANQIVTMAGAEFMGGKVLSLLSKARYGKSIASATQVFGAESAQVRNLISKQKLLANPSNNGVIGWTVATLENNYQDAVSRGLKGWEVVTSMATQSFITGIASKISPDVKFFRESKTLEEGLIQALRNGNSGLAKSLVNQFVNAIPKAMTRDVAPEILQEYSERFGQTAGEIITTVATGKNSVTNFNLEEFRDIGLETAATVATLGLIGHARGQGKTFEYDGKNFDISRLNRQEQLSLLANIYNPQIFKDFKDNFGVTGNKLNEVENRVKEVKKYIDKIPEKEKYSLDSMFKVGVLLQKIEVERENLRKDDGAFAERINRKIAAYIAEVNAILDNDINTETKTENPATNNTTENAETAQSTPQSETVQGSTETTTTTPTEGEQSSIITNPTEPKPNEPSGSGGAESSVNKQESYKIAGETSKQDQNPNAIGDFLLKNSEVGDTITDKSGDGYEITEVNTRKDGTKELIIVPFELINGEKDYNYSGTKLITERNKKDASSLYEFSYTDNKGDRVTETYNYNTKNQNETDTTETTTQPDTTTVENLQDIPADVTNETPQNEEDIVLPDTDWDALLGNLEIDDNEKVQTANIGTDGNPESGIDSVQQQGQAQTVAETTNNSGSESDAEVTVQPTTPFSDNEQAKPLNENQKRIADNVIATKESFISPDGEDGVRVTVTDNEGNAVEDKNGDYEFEFGTVAEADKFIDQKQKGYSLASNRKNTPKAEVTETTNNAYAGQRVSFTFLGEKQSGIIQEGNTILGDDGKKYPKGLAKNVTDVDGNKIDFQTTQADFIPIPQSTYDKLVKRLLGVFKKFGGKVITTKAEVDAKLKEFGVADYMIKAFHGSPHRFDRFSTEFMGSGEGQQAFGWGLYFTDLESIARNYANNLANLEIVNAPKDINDDLNKIFTKVNNPFKGKSDYITKEELESFLSKVSKYAEGEQYGRGEDKQLFDLVDNVWSYVQDNYDTIEIKANKNLYKVSLHKGKQPSEYTWLEWDKPLSDKLINSILKSKNEEVIALLDEYKDLNSRIETNKRALDSVTKERNLFIDSLKEKYNEEDTRILQNLLSKEEELKGDESAERVNTLEQERKDLQNLQKSKEGRYVYENLKEILGSDKEASLFLLENGIDGVKYPAESISRGATSNNARGFNYVVFDENAVTIDEVVEFMKTPNGEIYGAKFPDGTIYLNPEQVNANTPIHEFSHLWQQLMPARFKKGVELLKNTPIGKKTFAELKENKGYEGKTDDELWNEALVTVMGNEGERIFNQSKVSKFREWFVDFFKKLGEVFGIKEMSPNDKLSTFVKGALSEVMGTKEIIPESSVEQKEVPIYIKKMSNTDLRTMLDKLGLVMDAVCPN